MGDVRGGYPKARPGEEPEHPRQQPRQSPGSGTPSCPSGTRGAAARPVRSAVSEGIRSRPRSGQLLSGLPRPSTASTTSKRRGAARLWGRAGQPGCLGRGAGQNRGAERQPLWRPQGQGSLGTRTPASHSEERAQRPDSRAAPGSWRAQRPGPSPPLSGGRQLTPPRIPTALCVPLGFPPPSGAAVLPARRSASRRGRFWARTRPGRPRGAGVAGRHDNRRYRLSVTSPQASRPLPVGEALPPRGVRRHRRAPRRGEGPGRRRPRRRRAMGAAEEPGDGG